MSKQRRWLYLGVTGSNNCANDKLNLKLLYVRFSEFAFAEEYLINCHVLCPSPFYLLCQVNTHWERIQGRFPKCTLSSMPNRHYSILHYLHSVLNNTFGTGSTYYHLCGYNYLLTFPQYHKRIMREEKSLTVHLHVPLSVIEYQVEERYLFVAPLPEWCCLDSPLSASEMAHYICEANTWTSSLTLTSFL